MAIVCNGDTLAVMMATPDHLADFAIGFCWSEGISSRPLERARLNIVAHRNGIECRVELDDDDRLRLRQRSRHLVSGSSCGLCGVRSLAQAVPVPPTVGGEAFRLDETAIHTCIRDLRALQPLHDRTRSAHAAALFVPGRGIVAVREDIGRHSALDKLIGNLLQSGQDPASGTVVLTSRVSVEMVQKVAASGAPMIIAASAPSALGVRVAQAAGITLVGSARRARFSIHTHAWRFDTDVAEQARVREAPQLSEIERHEPRQTTGKSDHE